MADKKSTAVEERQLVVFDLARESYGVDIIAVQSIIRMQPITKVPRTMEFVEGVINLRGTVIPVVDLRKRFGLTATEETKDSRIVVVDISGQEVGMVVDAVTEVLRISSDSIEPPSSVITSADSAYLLGIAKIMDKLVILLDLEEVFTDADKQALSSSYTQAEAKIEEVESAPETATESVATAEIETGTQTEASESKKTAVAGKK